MKKILLFSPICKPKEILEVSLPSYLALNAKGFEIDFLFYDDNKEEAASLYVKSLEKSQQNVSILPPILYEVSAYQDHKWTLSQIDRIITIKNEAIKYALKYKYDGLFLVDADLVLHPNTLSHLASLDLDFVFEVFWTLFFREAIHKPNAWDKHSWVYDGPETLLKLKSAGTHEVGGGGACTLLSRKLMKDGVDFRRLKSLPYQGEDRHICTHAQAKGYSIMVNTNYPAYHIFLNEQVKEALDWYNQGCQASFFDQWLDTEWERLVKQTFVKPKLNFFMKLKHFQYEVRKSFSKHILNA